MEKSHQIINVYRDKVTGEEKKRREKKRVIFLYLFLHYNLFIYSLYLLCIWLDHLNG